MTLLFVGIIGEFFAGKRFQHVRQRAHQFRLFPWWSPLQILAALALVKKMTCWDQRSAQMSHQEQPVQLLLPSAQSKILAKHEPRVFSERVNCVKSEGL